MDQEDQGDHNPPWTTRSGFYIWLMFSGSKKELIQWRTHSQRTSHPASPVDLDCQLSNPQRVIRWLGYCLILALAATHHYRHRLSRAQVAFFFVKRVSSPEGGVRPFLCQRVARGLLLSILTYGADLYTPNSSALRGMNSSCHIVQRWTTNPFYSTPISILSREPGLPPLVTYGRYRRRLAGLWIACALPTTNPVVARLPSSCPSL